MTAPVVLCSGSDCAKDERVAYRALRNDLVDAGVCFDKSKCLGVCKGPVVVVGDGPSATVLGGIRSPKARRAVVRACVADDPAKVAKGTGALSSRVVKKKKRAKALKKAGIR